MIKCPTCGIDRELFGGNCECNQLQPEWDEVVEDGAYLSFNTVVELDQNNLNEILAHRLDLIKDELTPVRIKCRDGAILIERLKGVGK